MCFPEDLWDTDAWLKDHPDIPCAADSMLAASQGFGSILNAMRIAETTSREDRHRARMIVHALNQEATKWENSWFSATNRKLSIWPSASHLR
jgi:hypothetical protein